jgi:hypothetical protein
MKCHCQEPELCFVAEQQELQVQELVLVVQPEIDRS